MSSPEGPDDGPNFQIRYEAEPDASADLPDDVFDSFLCPLDDPDPIETLEELVAGLPPILTPVATAFSKNLKSVVSVGTPPYQMASAAVAQRRCDRLWIAEQIRARKYMDETGNVPDAAKQEAFATARKRFEEELRPRETVDVMASHVVTTLSGGIRSNETFHFACAPSGRCVISLVAVPAIRWGRLRDAGTSWHISVMGELGATAGFIFRMMLPAVGLLLLLALWIAYGVLFGVRGARVTRRQAGELTLLAVGPLALAGWATVAYGWASTPQSVSWPIHVLNALAVASLALSVYLWRRHGEIAPFSALAAVGAVFATALAWVIGLMAIGNDWL